MNKRILFTIIYFIIINSCYNDKYVDWQDVILTDIGTFKVPKEWIVTNSDDMIYITDKPIEEENYKIYLVGVPTSTRSKKIKEYDIFKDVEFIDFASHGVVYSNGGRYWVEKLSINGVIQEKYVIIIGGRYSEEGIYNDINLFSWDDLIDKETIIKITNSFTRVFPKPPKI